jgi:hypothetical protein
MDKMMPSNTDQIIVLFDELNKATQQADSGHQRSHYASYKKQQSALGDIQSQLNGYRGNAIPPTEVLAGLVQHVVPLMEYPLNPQVGDAAQAVLASGEKSLNTFNRDNGQAASFGTARALWRHLTQQPPETQRDIMLQSGLIEAMVEAGGIQPSRIITDIGKLPAEDQSAILQHNPEAIDTLAARGGAKYLVTLVKALPLPIQAEQASTNLGLFSVLRDQGFTTVKADIEERVQQAAESKKITPWVMAAAVVGSGALLVSMICTIKPQTPHTPPMPAPTAAPAPSTAPAPTKPQAEPPTRSAQQPAPPKVG